MIVVTSTGGRPAGPAVSSTVPQAWHSPQRPDHFVVRQPHSAQRYNGGVDDFPMVRTVAAGYDNPVGPDSGRRWSRPAKAAATGANGMVMNGWVGPAA